MISSHSGTSNPQAQAQTSGLPRPSNDHRQGDNVNSAANNDRPSLDEGGTEQRRRSSSDATPRPTPAPHPRHLGTVTHDTNSNVLGHTTSASDFFNSSKRALFSGGDKGTLSQNRHLQSDTVHSIPLLSGRETANEMTKVLLFLVSFEYSHIICQDTFHRTGRRW
jgi:hypothetical protein